MILSFYRCILTPNKVEFERLVQDTIAHYNSHPSSTNDGDDGDYLNNSRYIHRDEYISSLRNDKADNGYIHGDGGSSSSSSSSSSNDQYVEYRKVYSLSRALGGITILKKGTVRMMIVMIMVMITMMMVSMMMVIMMMVSMMVMIMTMMIITMMMTIIMMMMMMMMMMTITMMMMMIML